MATRHYLGQPSWAAVFKTTIGTLMQPRPLSRLTMASPLVPLSFTKATEMRRTRRALTSKTTVDDSVIIKIAEAAILTVPSAFNNQSARMTIVFRTEHQKLWSITADALLAKIGPERWNSGPKDRISGFASAYGTIMFWDDGSCADTLKENAPEIYKDKTDEWVQQSNGMHQYYVWTALSALGLGVNLQHYNPLIDTEVKRTWDISADWKLRAQMVFGVPESGSGLEQKEQKLPLEQRVHVFGAKM